MPTPVSDRDIRVLVAELAVARRRDVAAILDDLVPDDRAQVEELLHEYLGQAAPADSRATAPSHNPQSFQRSGQIEGVSPWMAARCSDDNGAGLLGEPTQARTALGGPFSPEAVAPYRMAPNAQAVLRGLASALPRIASQPPVSAPRGGPSMLSRLTDLVLRSRSFE